MSVNSKMTAIADAIRSQTGDIGALSLDDMPPAIRKLGGSQIIVTAPAGSKVTATMAGITKTAAEKNGTWAFKNCDLGTWTITATLGDKSKAITVKLTRLEIVYIDITYELYLYNAGDECTAVTGGWGAKGMQTVAGGSGGIAKQPTVTKNADSVKLFLGKGDYYCGIYYVINRIDLTGYKTLVVKGTQSGNANGVKIWTSLGAYQGTNCVVDKTIKASSFTESVDISALTGLHTVGFYIGSNVTVDATVVVNECRLE